MQKPVFPGLEKHEPEILEPIYFKDPVSYINDLLIGAHGPLVLHGKVTEVNASKSSFKINDEKVLANKHTVMLVPASFRGLDDLKGQEVFIYSITNPIPGRTYVAAAVMVKDAIPVIRESLARVALNPDDEVKTVAQGKILSIDMEKSTVRIDNNGKQQILNLFSSMIIDTSDPGRKDLSVDFLREGDMVRAEGYDISRVHKLYIDKKFSPKVSRNELDLNVYFITDLLGYFSPFEVGGVNAYSFLPEEEQKSPKVITAEVGGLAYLTSDYKDISKKEKNNLFICSGNFLYGSPLAKETKGEAVVTALNKLGVEAAVLGDQDFLLGKEQLLKVIGMAEFPILASNVLVAGTNDLLPGLKPYIVKEYNGVKVGILGLVSSDIAEMVPHSSLDGIAINSVKGALIQYYSKLETEADVILILANQRFYDNLLLANDFENILPGAKKKPLIIIGGEVRSFSAPEPIDTNDILILEAGTKGRYLAHLNLGVTKDFTDKNYSYYASQVSPSLIETPDPEMAELVNTMTETLPEIYSEVLGTSLSWFPRFRTNQSILGSFITDVLLETSGADVALYNSRHLRNDLFQGDITYGDLYYAIPYDFKMVTVELKGKDLLEIINRSLRSDDILQFAGMTITVSPNAPEGEKIKEVLIGETPISETAVYKVVTTDFLAHGGEGYRAFRDGTILEEGAIVRDVIADYIRANKEIKEGNTERIIVE